MPGFMDKMRRLNVSAVSPRRLASARMRYHDGIDIELYDGATDLDAAALSAEVAAAVRGALSGAAKAGRIASGRDPDAAADEPADAEAPKATDPPETPVQKRRRVVRKETSQLTGSGSAAEGLVKVGIRGGAEVQVRLAPKAPAWLGHDGLQKESTSSASASRVGAAHAGSRCDWTPERELRCPTGGAPMPDG